MNILNKIILTVALIGLSCFSTADAQAQTRVVSRNYPLAPTIAVLSGLPEWYVKLNVPPLASIRGINGNELTGFNLEGTASLSSFGSTTVINWKVTANVPEGQTQPEIRLETNTTVIAWFGSNNETKQSKVLSTPEQFALDGVDPDAPAEPAEPEPPAPEPPPPAPPAEPAPNINSNAGGGGGGGYLSAPNSSYGSYGGSWNSFSYYRIMPSSNLYGTFNAANMQFHSSWY